MKIMVNSKRWLRWTGIYVLDSDDTFPLSPNRRTALNIFFCVYPAIPQCIYVWLNADMLVEITQALYAAITFVGLAVKLLLLWLKRDDVYTFLRALENYVNERMLEKNTDVLQRMESKLARFSYFYGRMVFSSCILYTIIPGVLQFRAYITDTVTNTTYEAPFHDEYYFFDASTTPMFYICYALTSISEIFVFLTFMATDLLFVSVSMYIVALYQELQFNLRQVDENMTVMARYNALVQCIRFHKDILSFIKIGNQIFGRIFFVQFTYSLLVMAAVVFAAIFVEYTRVLVLVHNFLCLMSELFLMCYTGSLVLDEALKLRKAVYDVPWYKFTRNEKQLLQVMLMRTQKTDGFNAFKYFYCNNDFFRLIISKVFSSIAFLRSML